jgi:tellurite methyltransferase
LSRRGSDREFWNEKHGQVQVGGWVPRPWLVDHRALLDELSPGRALDVACGRGREALYLAGAGFEVDAVDVSDVAVDAVGEAARERELAVRATRVDLLADPAPFPHPPYDVVVGFYFLQRSLLGPIADVLASGGLLFYETFTRDHVDVLGRDMNERFLLDHNELLRAFSGLRVLRYREAVIGDERSRAVASIVARKQ